MIKEIIIVEGKDDIGAIKRAVDAEVIATGGFALRPDTMEKIKTAGQKRGLVIFTDPDFAGEKIRKIISSQIPNCKHAFLPREKTSKDGDIGIENASPEDIVAALQEARLERVDRLTNYSLEDLAHNNLIASPQASRRRRILGQFLGIGYSNGKQFLSRLNNYGIEREEWQEGLRYLERCEKNEEDSITQKDAATNKET